jgi:hypothetical protein
MAQKPTLCFVLDGFPRTGSTTLTRILNLHKDIQCAMEPFHPKRYEGVYNDIAQEQGVSAAIREIGQQNHNGLKHIWEPETSWPFVGRQDLNDAIVAHAEVVITVRRRNLLKQFVSGYVCRHLRFWVGTRADFYARLNTVVLPPIRVSNAAAAIEAAHSAIVQRETLLATLPARQRVLYYEDIFRDNTTLDQQVNFCNDLFGFLGFAALDSEKFRRECKSEFSPDIYKWSSDEIYARIPGVAALDRALGNDETGRIFA